MQPDAVIQKCQDLLYCTHQQFPSERFGVKTLTLVKLKMDLNCLCTELALGCKTVASNTLWCRTTEGGLKIGRDPHWFNATLYG